MELCAVAGGIILIFFIVLLKRWDISSLQRPQPPNGQIYPGRGPQCNTGILTGLYSAIVFQELLIWGFLFFYLPCGTDIFPIPPIIGFRGYGRVCEINGGEGDSKNVLGIPVHKTRTFCNSVLHLGSSNFHWIFPYENTLFSIEIECLVQNLWYCQLEVGQMRKLCKGLESHGEGLLPTGLCNIVCCHFLWHIVNFLSVAPVEALEAQISRSASPSSNLTGQGGYIIYHISHFNCRAITFYL